MKTSIVPRSAICHLLSTSFALLASASALLAQGSLTPPGAPAPTMKSLAQVEPRIIVNAVNTPGDATSSFIISQPGSYYLTSNITGTASKNGIVIAASGVTLDLMGFEIAGVASSLSGVFVGGTRDNLAVRNGTVRGWGSDGVDAFNAYNGQYQDLRLSDNGQNGLECGGTSTVINCMAQNNGYNGFQLIAGGSSVSRCIAYINDMAGFSATGPQGTVISDCSASSNTGPGISMGPGCIVSNSSAVGNSSHGISVGSSSTVSDCAAKSNTGNGISADVGSTISGCTAYINQQNGISVSDGSTVSECTTRSNTLNGIVTAFDCTVSNCTARRNDGAGINAGTGNTVSECTASFNGVHGIVIASDCLVRHNNCRQNVRIQMFSAGIYAAAGQNRIEDNNATGNYYPIDCPNPGNIVIRNTASSSGFGYSFNNGNTVGPIIAGTNPITSNNPWANFSY